MLLEAPDDRQRPRKGLKSCTSKTPRFGHQRLPVATPSCLPSGRPIRRRPRLLTRRPSHRTGPCPCGSSAPYSVPSDTPDGGSAGGGGGVGGLSTTTFEASSSCASWDPHLSKFLKPGRAHHSERDTRPAPPRRACSAGSSASQRLPSQPHFIIAVATSSHVFSICKA